MGEGVWWCSLCILGFGKALIAPTIKRNIELPIERYCPMSEKPIRNTAWLACNYYVFINENIASPPTPSVVYSEVYFIGIMINSLYTLLTWVNETMIMYANWPVIQFLICPWLHLLPVIRIPCLVHIKEYV